MEDVRVPAQAC
ncbi:hypothetical protein RDI58_007329 [Solanum bulbocastanum]|uniref:Uncharacterized protein n=1 Tax=Solanum bulbocastanum TaxID=147425 RepID=A0AAN8TYK2_SOLBU